jgi:hypothetical protein
MVQLSQGQLKPEEWERFKSPYANPAVVGGLEDYVDGYSYEVFIDKPPTIVVYEQGREPTHEKPHESGGERRDEDDFVNMSEASRLQWILREIMEDELRRPGNIFEKFL